jgi:RNA polymerase sigma-70 factor (ECF subfamily)
MAGDSSTDPSLLRLLGDPAVGERVWETFVELYQPKMLHWCTQLGAQSDDAEEVCSRVLIKLVLFFREWRYDPARSFRGFLHTTVVNALTDVLRERRRKPGNWGSGGDPPEFAERVRKCADEVDLQATEFLEVIDQAMELVRARANPQSWDCFWKQEIEGLTGPEIAELLRIPVANVYVCRQRILERLRKEAQRLWAARRANAENS